MLRADYLRRWAEAEGVADLSETNALGWLRRIADAEGEGSVCYWLSVIADEPGEGDVAYWLRKIALQYGVSDVPRSVNGWLLAIAEAAEV